MSSYFQLILLITLFVVTHQANYDRSYLPPKIDEPPCTMVHQGAICGKTIKTRGGRSVAAYKGIPYAQPPIAQLRFKDPEPASEWCGIYNATDNPPRCIQKNYLYTANPKVEGQEDCLYLNVYTPSLSSLNSGPRQEIYPVMFYIHGGGWFSGSGDSLLNGPDYIMDENVVLVTINYRLGVFGFLSTLDEAATGNWALKDMTLALEWVRDNIGQFSGDPNRVTIFGQSAGAASVHYLVLSPRTQGLFHQAISESGQALSVWANPIDSLQVAQLQATFVNCPVNKTNQDLIDCLRNIDPVQLCDSGDNFHFFSIDPLTIYIPSIEKTTPANPNPFLPDKPLNLIKNMTANPVPYILGVVRNEGLIRAGEYVTKPLREEINNKWDTLGPQLFGLAISVPNNESLVPVLWKQMNDKYMKGEKIIANDPDNIQRFINMYGDRVFHYGTHQAVKFHAQKGGNPVYMYHFDFGGRDTWSDLFAHQNLSNSDVNFKFEKCHCDELNYLFRIPEYFPEPFAEGSIEEAMSKRLVKIWTTFAQDGNPGKFWKNVPQGTTNITYLHIKGPDNMSMETDLFGDRMQFWSNLDILENH